MVSLVSSFLGLLISNFSSSPLIKALSLLHLYHSQDSSPLLVSPSKSNKTHLQKSKLNKTHLQKSKSSKTHLFKSSKSPLNYAIKGLLLALLIRVYDYKQYLHPNFILLLYCFHIYLNLELILALVSALVRFLLGLELEPQFDDPFLSTSLQDFWGRRWNLMVTGILRPTVYQPLQSFCTRIIGKRWAQLVSLLATFVVSGLMHELIFYYFGRVWPSWEVMSFFALHGVCLAVEVEVKRYFKDRWRLHQLVTGPLTVVFVLVTGSWLFFPQYLRCGADVRAIREYAVMGEFVKGVGRNIWVLIGG